MCSHCYKCIFGPSVCRLCQKPWNSFPTLRRSFPTIWLKFFKCEGSGWQRTWQLLLGVVLCWGRGHPPSSPVLAPPLSRSAYFRKCQFCSWQGAQNTWFSSGLAPVPWLPPKPCPGPASQPAVQHVPSSPGCSAQMGCVLTTRRNSGWIFPRRLSSCF